MKYTHSGLVFIRMPFPKTRRSEYLQQCFDVTWRKSACVACPFNALKEDGIERHREHPEQVAEAMMLEHLSLSLNPRGTLYAVPPPVAKALAMEVWAA